MPYDPTQRGYAYVDGELPIRQRQPGSTRTAQVLPRKNYDSAELARQARHQAREEARQRNRPAAQPKQTFTTTRRPEIDEEIEDEILPSIPRSALRYRPIADADIDTRQGVRVEHHYHDQPFVARKSRQSEASPNQERYEEYEEEQPIRKRRGVRPHYLVFVGIGLLLMLAGYIALNLFGSWWQTHQDDVTYGNPRTYQTDVVVGHNDSAATPTHFIAVNLKGQVIVIELPGGNTAKAISYAVTTIPDNSANPPVKLLFQDLNHDGKLDMVIEIGDPGSQVTIILYNNGSQFVAKL